MAEGPHSVKEGTVYPRMFSGKFRGMQTQKKVDQIIRNTEALAD
jgi:hypothetical protein